jgi:hypothetical protein
MGWVVMPVLEFYGINHIHCLQIMPVADATLQPSQAA